MRILVSYRGAPRIRRWETGAMVARALRTLGHDVTEYAKVYEEDQWLLTNSEYDGGGLNAPRLNGSFDLHIYMECNDPEPQYMETLAIRAHKRVFWSFDVSYYPDITRQFARFMRFDKVFCANDRFLREDFWGCPVHPLAYGVDPTLHVRPLDTEKAIDVGLVGSDRPARRELIHKLRDAGMNARLISDVFRDEYVDALATCKVVINENPPEGEGLLNMRHWEAQAAGAALVSGDGEYAITSPMMLYYTDDPVASCKHALKDDLWCEAARFNQSCVLGNDTYQDRVDNLLHWTFE